MKFTIGSLVLCYLFSPAPQGQNRQEKPPVIKVWGEVLDFKERMALYDKDKQIPVAYIQKVDDIIVKGHNKGGIYQINAQACKVVKEIPKDAKKPDFKEFEPKPEEDIKEEEKVVDKDDLELKKAYIREQLAKRKKLQEKPKKEIKDTKDKGVIDYLLE